MSFVPSAVLLTLSGKTSLMGFKYINSKPGFEVQYCTVCIVNYYNRYTISIWFLPSHVSVLPAATLFTTNRAHVEA